LPNKKKERKDHPCLSQKRKKEKLPRLSPEPKRKYILKYIPKRKVESPKKA